MIINGKLKKLKFNLLLTRFDIDKISNLTYTFNIKKLTKHQNNNSIKLLPKIQYCDSAYGTISMLIIKNYMR
jgi:hypothetical protein